MSTTNWCPQCHGDGWVPASWQGSDPEPEAEEPCDVCKNTGKVSETTTMPTVEEIVTAWLKEHDYDGLYDGDGCWCEATHPFDSCEKDCSGCRPGYRVAAIALSRMGITVAENPTGAADA